jgi:hypothetical protein
MGMNGLADGTTDSKGYFVEKGGGGSVLLSMDLQKAL